MKIITGRRHWVLTEKSPRLTTMDDTRRLFSLPAFLNDVAGIHPGLISLNEIMTPVLEFFLACIEHDLLCYNIFVSSQYFFCRHKPISNSKVTDQSASSVSTLPGNIKSPTKAEFRVFRVGKCFLTV